MNNLTIYSKSKNGKITSWNASLNETLNSNGFLEITITSGYEDGKKIERIREVKSGKNLGRANATTILEQARLELKKLYTDKIDKGYVLNKSDISDTKEVGGIKKPTLADKYPEKAHKLPEFIYECGLQPKIDGLRCFIEKLEDNSIQFSSRSGKLFNPIPHIAEEAERELEVGDILDGELYIPGKDLQDIMSVVSPSKNIKDEALKEVKLYWYDFIPSSKTHETYKKRFLECDLNFDSSIVKLETSVFTIEESIAAGYIDPISTSSDVFIEMLENHFNNYIERNFEGLMIRDISAPYHFGRRTTSLLKYKKMISDEFKIVDILESDNDEAPRFVCDLRNGNQVTVRLKGDKEDNLKYLTDKEDYIGKWLTINYQTETSTGSLQFPVGIAIRDGEEINGTFVPSI